MSPWLDGAGYTGYDLTILVNFDRWDEFAEKTRDFWRTDQAYVLCTDNYSDDIY